MLKLSVTNEMIDYHLAYFKQYINKNFEAYIIYNKFMECVNEKELEKDDYFRCFCRIFRLSQLLKNNWERIAIGEPKKLRRINKCFEKIYNSFGKHEIIIKSVVGNILSYDNFRKGHKNDGITKENKYYKAKNWNPYMWSEKMNVRTCSYCNRQYVTCLKKSKDNVGGIRPDIDHYWCRNTYPHFSMSLYNWVPSCKICNSSLKHDKNIDIKMATLYEEGIADTFRFEATGIIPENNKIEIVVRNIGNSDMRDKLLEMFRIKEVYASHNNIAVNFVKKRIIYNNEFIKKLSKHNNKYAQINQAELLPLVIGYPIDEDRIDEEALGKLRYDLAKQLGFMEYV